MHIYIVYAHPARDSFHRDVLKTFTSGLQKTGHTYELGDLYRMGFTSEMDRSLYQREISLDPLSPVPDDIKKEQDKIDQADALSFIYPVWWSDCPAIMKGWFDRVWTHGYAYFYDDQEERHTRVDIEKALVICAAGHPVEHLEKIGIAQSMRTIMLNDRLLGVGVREARMEILGGMTAGDSSMKKANLARVSQLAKTYFS